MRVLGQIVAAVLLLFSIFTPPATADIISVKIRSDNRDMILFSNFEFSYTGSVSVAVSSVGISSMPVASNLSHPDPSRIGFFLLSDDLSHRYDLEFKRNPDLCPLDNEFISVLFTFRDLSPHQSSFHGSYNVTYPGGYSLYFANCNDFSTATMDVRAELYNAGGDGTTKDHLSAGQPRPFLYLSFFLAYLCLQGLWIYVSITNHHCIQLIHLPLSALLVTNLVYFICAVAYQHDMMVTGTHHGWHMLFYICRFMRDMNLYTVIVLIGAGWCNWRRSLPNWVAPNWMIVMILQVWANVSFMEVGKSGPYDEHWLDLRARFTTLDIICCIFVSSHANCSAVSFKFPMDTSLKEATATARHDVFLFPFLVLAYICFTRGSNDVLQSTTAVQETCTLVFSMAMFYMYRPFVLDDEDQKYAGFLDHSTGV